MDDIKADIFRYIHWVKKYNSDVVLWLAVDDFERIGSNIFSHTLVIVKYTGVICSLAGVLLY